MLFEPYSTVLLLAYLSAHRRREDTKVSGGITGYLPGDNICLSWGRSDSAFPVRKTGLLDLNSTRGPDAGGMLQALNVQNTGRLFLGSNVLSLRTFRQSASGLTKLRVTKSNLGGIRARDVTLSGHLKVLGRTSVGPGQYPLITAKNQRTGRFDKVTFIGFKAGLTKGIKYDGNRVLLVVK